MADQSPAALTPRAYFSLGPFETRQTRLLNSAEQAQLSRQQSRARQRAYLRTRLLLRLGATESCRVLGQPTPDFSRLNASGPPILPGSHLHVGLAHTGPASVCAVHEARVGIDIEPVNRRVSHQALARRWFTEREQSWLNADANKSAERFLLLWTLKEAWIKAHHQPIAGNLQSLQWCYQGSDVGSLVAATEETDWQAASTVVAGHRLSLVWQGGGRPCLADLTGIAAHNEVMPLMRKMPFDLHLPVHPHH